MTFMMPSATCAATATIITVKAPRVTLCGDLRDRIQTITAKMATR